MKTLLRITCLLCVSSLAAPTCFQDRKESIKIRQSPKQILAHPGQSVTISCVVTSPDVIKAVHLKKNFTKILFIHSIFGVTIYNDRERITVTGTAANFSVTIKGLKENDAATYLCDGVSVDDQDLCGDRTVLAVDSRTKPQSQNEAASKRDPDSQHDKWQTGIRKPSRCIFAKTGDSVSFTCSITSKQKIRRVWLQKETTRLVLVYNSDDFEIKQDYENRLRAYGTFSHFTATLSNVSDADADFYSCKGDKEDGEDEEVIISNGTMVVIDAFSDKESELKVQHAKSAQPQDPFTVLVCVVVVLTVILLVVAACFMGHCYTNKKYQIPRNPLNTVYEEMTLRRDTMTSNCYSNM